MRFFVVLSLVVFSITDGYSQDYLISFAGEGAATNIDSVKVDNLTNHRSIIIPGDNQLRLKSKVLDSRFLTVNTESALRIYPNPSKEFCSIQIDAIKEGIITLEIFDLAGKHLVHIQSNLASGKHSYSLSGLGNGVYLVKVKTDESNYMGKIISQSDSKRDIQIRYNDNLGNVESMNENNLKSTNSETIMQYTPGDRLKLTGISGNYSTVLMDIPTESKTITFSFVTCTDADNNNYPVVQIGAQIWMAENLKSIKYRNGNPIPNVQVASKWIINSKGAYCDYNHMPENGLLYGKIYNWYVVSDTNKICPTDWHMPSKTEWLTLINYLGGEYYAADKMREVGTEHWLAPNKGGTNESGFTALPAGYFEGDFYGLTTLGSWWSSSEENSIAWFTHMESNNQIRCSYGTKNIGSSVRCVKYNYNTEMHVPIINTVEIINKLQTEATSGGKIIYDGGAAITSQGVCWGTSPNPDTTNNRIVDNTGTENFISNINGLTTNTTYYIRAYATNEIGTGYGNELIFTTLSEPIYDSVSDVEGNFYKTVIINTQNWMAENLKTTKFNNGINIPLTTENSEWINLTGPGYCWYNNDEPTYKSTYGALYNWYAVKRGNLCPTGWHVPTLAEMEILITYLGGVFEAEDKLIETGTTHWLYNIGANNASGFTALPAGFRKNDGVFDSMSRECRWWTSTELSAGLAWFRGLSDFETYVTHGSNNESIGYSIRCLED